MIYNIQLKLSTLTRDELDTEPPRHWHDAMMKHVKESHLRVFLAQNEKYLSIKHVTELTLNTCFKSQHELLYVYRLTTLCPNQKIL